jgi:hypothetical protein
MVHNWLVSCKSPRVLNWTELNWTELSWLRGLAPIAHCEHWTKLLWRLSGTDSLISLLPSLYNNRPAQWKTLAFLLFVAMQRNSTGPASVSMEVFNCGFLATTRPFTLWLPSNDGIRPNTSQYIRNWWTWVTQQEVTSAQRILNLFCRCKIWDYRRGDYEVCRLMGYKNPVRTS